MRMKEEALTELYARQNVAFQDRVYPLHSLRNLLGGQGANEVQPITRCCCCAAASSASRCTSTR